MNNYRFRNALLNRLFPHTERLLQRHLKKTQPI